MAENKLHVENLTISFHTDAGKVQAVRGINFDLKAGETLSIVGESGSGKSVTSKAILGILAPNAIIEGGEILYDGQDLLKISEEDFHKIRGDKIAMIFQDPMSSLNPIVKIGRQLTEAMILKGAARQKESRTLFNGYLKTLKETMVTVNAGDDKEKAKIYTDKCENFNKFEYKHLELESAYNTAHEAAVEAVEDIDVLSFEISKDAADDLSYRIKRVLELAKNSIQEYVVKDEAEALTAKLDEAKASLKAYLAATRTAQNKARRDKELNVGEELAPTREPLISSLESIKTILNRAIGFDVPNLFTLGYYQTFGDGSMPADLNVNDMNAFTRKYLDDNFMLDFIADTKKAIEYTAGITNENRQKAVELLTAKRSLFETEDMDEKTCDAAYEEMKAAIADCIDKLAIKKDSQIYTFASGFKTSLDKYFKDIVNNANEIKRFEKETAKRDKLVAKGKDPDWKVVPAFQVDLEEAREHLCHVIDSMKEHLNGLIEAEPTRNFDEEAVGVIDYLKTCASGVVNKVTARMAKDKALRLMEEVGIAEPRRRFDQYPFEFSGGMRQRIVIAIALAANPDILICDEPTTALDVTIQSQILELINKLKEERHLSVIFITHDLGVVANMADRIAVMYAGKIVEYGTADDIFYRPAHPYTWALLSSMPDLDTNEKLEAIPGTPPNMIYPPVGDAFAARNKYAMQIDFEMQPPMFQISDTHYAATWLLHPDAPKLDIPKTITDRIARMKSKWEE